MKDMNIRSHLHFGSLHIQAVCFLKMVSINLVGFVIYSVTFQVISLFVR